jgi:hypothetical protein
MNKSYIIDYTISGQHEIEDDYIIEKAIKNLHNQINSFTSGRFTTNSMIYDLG